MTNFINHDFPKLKRITREDGFRVYETPSGLLYPSVTTVIGHGKNEYVEKWKERVGEEEVERVRQRAGARGTRIHTLCENFFLDKPLDVSFFDQEIFNQIKPELENIDNIHCLETQLYSDYLKVAGTVDCLAEYKGRLSVIDFKTSARNKHRSEISSYFEQTASYAVAFEERTGIPVNNLVIIMGIDESNKGKVFIEKRDDWVKSFMKKRFDFHKATGY